MIPTHGPETVARLRPSDLPAIAAACAQVMLVSALFRWGPHRACRARVIEAVRPRTPSNPCPARTRRVLRVALGAAQRLTPWPTTCLHRAVALQRWLERRGVGAVARIGVRRAQGRVEAHAWIETAGHRIELTGIPSLAFRVLHAGVADPPGEGG